MKSEKHELNRIEWVIRNTRLLAAIGDEYEKSKPFAGMRIAAGIHLEPKTASLLVTLQRGGAKVSATGNLNSTQIETTDYLTAHGVNVVGHQTQDADEHEGFLRQLVDEQPDLLLDNGGQLFNAYLDAPYLGLRGGTEETTSGRMRLAPLRDRLRMPIYVINDSPIKQYAENFHAVGQSVFESFMRITNLSTNGKGVTVFGYGACGQMDIGFALQARCLEFIASGAATAGDTLVPVPREIDAAVANAFVSMRTSAAAVHDSAEELTKAT